MYKKHETIQEYSEKELCSRFDFNLTYIQNMSQEPGLGLPVVAEPKLDENHKVDSFIPLSEWFSKEPDLAIPLVWDLDAKVDPLIPLSEYFKEVPDLATPSEWDLDTKVPLAYLGYYPTIMKILGVSTKQEIKQLADKSGMNFTEFCISVYDSLPKITIRFNDDAKH